MTQAKSPEKVVQEIRRKTRAPAAARARAVGAVLARPGRPTGRPVPPVHRAGVPRRPLTARRADAGRVCHPPGRCWNGGAPAGLKKRPKTLKPALRPVSHPLPEGTGGMKRYEYTRSRRDGQTSIWPRTWFATHFSARSKSRY